MKVAVIGAGLMGSQIGCEYALGGHDVTFVARRPTSARRRVEQAFRLVARYGLDRDDVIEEARGRIDITETTDGLDEDVEVVVESVVEGIDAKVRVLREAAQRCPRAILASNTSSLSISSLGDGSGAPERTIGTHYWNPPLLMPLVEVVRGKETDAELVDRQMTTLRELRKRPVLVERDVAGFIWNRMQLALLREAVWLVEQGVASPATVDEVVRDGLARRWRLTGPFETVALGGAETFERIAANLLPVLSKSEALPGLERWLNDAQATLDVARERRDDGLAAELQRERGVEPEIRQKAAP